ESVDELDDLNKKVFAPLKAEPVHIPKGKKEYQAFLERSHQTDDNEFYSLKNSPTSTRSFSLNLDTMS
ncbi:MAG: hypothetical protein ACUVV5_12600, partial [Candidatus Aminicenantales bacterium]